MPHLAPPTLSLFFFFFFLFSLQSCYVTSAHIYHKNMCKLLFFSPFSFHPFIQACRRRCFVQVWPLAVRAGPVTPAWATWLWAAASSPRQSVVTTALSSTAPTPTPTPTWPAAQPSVPSATPACPSCPTWPAPCPTPPSVTPTPGGSQLRGWSLRRCSWTWRLSSTSHISSWCFARRGLQL